MSLDRENEAKQQEIRRVQKQYKPFYDLLLGLFGVVILALLGAKVFEGDPSRGYAINLFTDAIAITFTVFVLDRRAKYREDKRLKDQLLRQMDSPDHALARQAIDELRANEWLQGDVIKGRTFYYAKWHGADLSGLDLEEVVLDGGDLEAVIFTGCNLHHAMLNRANLKGAKLNKCNLDSASFAYSNLETANFDDSQMISTSLANTDARSTTYLNARAHGASFRGSDLQHANFFFATLTMARFQEADLYDVRFGGSNLKGAKFQNANMERVWFSHASQIGTPILPAEMDNDTILPNGDPYTQTSDLLEFHYPDYPNFWRPKPDHHGHFPRWYKSK